MLVPLLTWRTALSATFRSVKEAWNAVYGTMCKYNSGRVAEVSEVLCITHRQQETHDAQAQQTSTHLSDGTIVDLMQITVSGTSLQLT